MFAVVVAKQAATLAAPGVAVQAWRSDAAMALHTEDGTNLNEILAYYGRVASSVAAPVGMPQVQPEEMRLALRHAILDGLTVTSLGGYLQALGLTYTVPTRPCGGLADLLAGLQ
jgi:hypothetical protein